MTTELLGVLVNVTDCSGCQGVHLGVAAEKSKTPELIDGIEYPYRFYCFTERKDVFVRAEVA